MSKGIAIQTILLLLVGVIVAGVLIYLVYSYATTSGLGELECRDRISEWCRTCFMSGFTAELSLTGELVDCAKKMLHVSFQADDNCGKYAGVQGQNSTVEQFCSSYLL